MMMTIVRHSASDRDLGMDRPITRRDFLNGVAIGSRRRARRARMLAGIPGTRRDARGGGLAQDAPGYYPPALTGMRGSHDGSFDVVARAARREILDDGRHSLSTRGETYDLVVVGGGISGLAAAYFYRARTPSARILILDNHDDFGGHAKRNEFRPGGTLLDRERRHRRHRVALPVQQGSARPDARAGHRSGRALRRGRSRRRPFGLPGPAERDFFDKETFGADRLVVGTPGGAWPRARRRSPVRRGRSFSRRRRCRRRRRRTSRASRTSNVDYMPGLIDAEKKDRLSRMSYKDFLLNLVKVHPDVIPFYQSRTHGLYGIGIDAVRRARVLGVSLSRLRGHGPRSRRRPVA